MQKEKVQLEEEKKEFEEEIRQKNEEIYQQEEKMIKYEFNKSMQDEKNEIVAIEWLYSLKDSNIKR